MTDGASELWPVLPCGGLPARCPTCIEIYRMIVGDEMPTCMVCGHRHWAYDPCDDDSGPTVGLGATS